MDIYIVSDNVTSYKINNIIYSCLRKVFEKSTDFFFFNTPGNDTTLFN